MKQRSWVVALSFLLNLASISVLAQGTIAPAPKHQFFDNNGVPLAGGKLFTYSAGTTTKQATYSDSALQNPNTNPIVLDSAGRATIFLSQTGYKFVMALSTDSDPPASPLWTVDNVLAVPTINTNVDIPVLFAVGVTSGQAVYLSDGSGGLTAGSWYLADSANAYSSTQAPMLGISQSTANANVSGTVRIIGRPTNLSGLTPGSSYYVGTAGALTSTAPGLPQRLIIADSTTTGIIAHVPQEASATTRGLVSIAAQSFAGTKTFLATPQYQPGTSTTAQPVNGVLNAQQSSTGIGNTGTSETTLFTYTVPAATLSKVGAVLKVTAIGSTAANANTKTIRFHFGATSVTFTAGAYNAIFWRGQLYVYTSGASAEVAVGSLSSSSSGPGSGNQTIIASPAETVANAITVTVTGQSGTASNDVLSYWFQVEVIGG